MQWCVNNEKVYASIWPGGVTAALQTLNLAIAVQIRAGPLLLQGRLSDTSLLHNVN